LQRLHQTLGVEVEYLFEERSILRVSGRQSRLRQVPGQSYLEIRKSLKAKAAAKSDDRADTRPGVLANLRDRRSDYFFRVGENTFCNEAFGWA